MCVCVCVCVCVYQAMADQEAQSVASALGNSSLYRVHTRKRSIVPF